MLMIVPGDFDNDGDVEFIGCSLGIPQNGGGYLMILYKEITYKLVNIPDGTLKPTFVAIGDANLDGRIDFFTNTYDKIIWYMQAEGGAKEV